MNALRHAPLLLVLLCLTACARKEGKPAPPAAAAPARAQFQTVADVPPQLRAECEAFARQLEQDIRQGRKQAVCAAFDQQAIVDAVCDGVHTSEANLSRFKTGFLSGWATGVEQIATTWLKEDPKFKRLVVLRGGPAARFRFTSDQTGITIIDLALSKDSQGKVGIADVLNHAMGYDMVEQARQNAALALAELDKGFLERLLGQRDIDAAAMKQFGQLSEKFRRRDFAGVIATYHSLPAKLRETLPAAAAHITALQQTGDLQAYKAALREAATRFKTVSFRLMLVDAYFLDKQYEKAVGCLDAFMQALEKDAALLTLKSLIQHAGGDVAAARASLQEALELEPDCVYAHAKGLDVLLAAKDYPTVRDSLIFLEKKRGQSFKGAMTAPVWDDFKKSPESAPWR